MKLENIVLWGIENRGSTGEGSGESGFGEVASGAGEHWKGGRFFFRFYGLEIRN